MLRLPLPLSLFICCLLSFSIYAQDNAPNLDNGTIAQQYENLLKKGGNYSTNGIRYEVIKIKELEKFKRNITDSMDIASKSLVELKNTIAENATEIDALKSSLNEKTENLEKLTAEKDSMAFLGTNVSKGAYTGIVWGIIVLLVFALTLFIYKFRKSNYLTVQAKSALSDLEAEYEQHRRRALEREQKISRELHDERNKNRKTN